MVPSSQLKRHRAGKSEGSLLELKKISDNCTVIKYMWYGGICRPRYLSIGLATLAPLASPLFGEAIGQHSLPQHLFTVACNEARCCYKITDLDEFMVFL
jgi:hypothetical protein